ncbi:MAG TPA: rhamnogalacturonan acetylesterase [Chitinophagaceae bacterium]|jgi:lysophospholipase L1-like esterase
MRTACRKNSLYILCSLFITTGALAQTSFKFDLGPGKTQTGYTQVLPSTEYTDALGYGFYNSTVTGVERGGKDALRDGYCSSDKPFFFSVKLPEGNYNVKVILGDKDGTSTTTIRAECRRLMVEKVETAKGTFKTVEFTVHVHDSIIRPEGIRVRLKPRERNYFHWDDKLTLEFANSSPKVCAIEITPNTTATTVFLAGNSTVVDQAEEPWAAWGQMIPSFFQPGNVAIANYAESGESLSSFIGERRFQKVLSLLKAGDYVFVEFAHNDQKQKGEGIGPWTSYTRDLKFFISEVRKKGATPVLVTSMNRRTFDSTGKIYNTLGDYPDAMRKVAKEENTALIDLNAKSKILYEAWGPEQSVKAFVHYPAHTFPGQDKELKDDTHFNPYGAYEIAKCIITGIRENKLPLAAQLRPGIPPFDPAHPDPLSQWSWPPSVLRPPVKPDGN